MDFFDRLVLFETDFWNAIERRLIQEDQVGLATLQALRVLDRHGGAGRVHELSEEVSITIGAASKLADRLERDGLVTRRPNPADRRSSLISVTAAGQRARESGEKIAEQVVSRVLRDEEDVASLSAAIERLHPIVEQVRKQDSR